MSLKHSGFYGVLITLLVTVSGVSTPLEGRDIETAQNARANTAGVDTLVTAEWLQEHLQDPGLVILDATVQVDFSDSGEILISSGRPGFDQGHIPTAQFADLTDDLVDTSSQYPYALPAPEKFASAMGALGVGDDSLVVVYSRDYSAWAARVSMPCLQNTIGARWSCTEEPATFPPRSMFPRCLQKMVTSLLNRRYGICTPSIRMFGLSPTAVEAFPRRRMPLSCTVLVITMWRFT